MFVVLLRFARNRDRAASLMDGHDAWLRAGFDEGVFLLSGSLQPTGGGAILASGLTRESLRDRLDADPFVAAGVVEAEVVEIAPGMADPRLQFLLH